MAFAHRGHRPRQALDQHRGAEQVDLKLGRDGTPVQFGQVAKTLREVEMEMIYHVLDKHEGDKPKTAQELGIALKTLYNKLNQYQTRAAG